MRSETVKKKDNEYFKWSPSKTYKYLETSEK